MWGQCIMLDPGSMYHLGCRRCSGQGPEYGWNGTLRAPTQRRIWHTVGVSSGAYTANLAATAVVGGPNNRPVASPGVSNLNWDQASDRARPHVQEAVVPSRGNSLRRTLTALRPGASAPGGAGVDVKHDSYARYLAQKRGRNTRTSPGKPTPGFLPLLNARVRTDPQITKGYKIGTFGIGAGLLCCS